MADTPLAAKEDVEGLLGRTLTEAEEGRLPAMLAKASADFRRHAGGRLFTPGESTVRVKVDGEQVWLSQAPVVEVTSVVDDAGSDVPFEHSGQVLRVHRSSATFVTVTYTHGSATVPDDVRLAVASCVARALNIDPRAVAGQTQAQRTETRGPFSETSSDSFATWAVGGSVTLSPDEVATARSYRAARPRVWVVRP